MRPVCTGAPVHYEQTVRARSTRPRAVAAGQSPPAVYDLGRVVQIDPGWTRG